MNEKLPLSLENALNNMAFGEMPTLVSDTKTLVKKGYITVHLSGGWMVTDKGIKYLNSSGLKIKSSTSL